MSDDPVNSGDQRDAMGRFAAGNPGRRRGSFNRATQLARLLLGRGAGPLVKKAIEMALAGDAVALRICIERLAPIPRAGAIQIDLPKIETLADVPIAMSRVIEGVAAGTLSLDDGERLAGLIDRARIGLEGPDLELRLRELESAYRGLADAQMAGPRRSPRPNGRDG